MIPVPKFKLILLVIFYFGSSANAAVPSKLAQFPEGERLVYTRLVQEFHKNQLAQLLHDREVLERGYPNSVHLDNAYYMTGMLRFQNAQYAEALRDFDIVRSRFSKSNKRPAAMFGIARTYAQLNLQPQAHRVLESIRAEYPGSPEAQRAWMELRMEKPRKK